MAIITQFGFIEGLWVFAVAFVLHEAEEWNIMRWYQRNYPEPPPSTARTARVWIVFSSLVGLIWCAAATFSMNPAVAGYVFLPAVFMAVQNALQHVYWLFYFKQYAPSVISATVLLIPLGGWLTVQALRHHYVPLWYIAILILLNVPGLVQTVKAKNRITPQILWVHKFSVKLDEWIGRLI